LKLCPEIGQTPAIYHYVTASVNKNFYWSIGFRSEILQMVLYPVDGCLATAPISAALNQWVVFRQIFTSINITGTSINTPTTVARAAPEDKPKSMVEVAMATSNLNTAGKRNHPQPTCWYNQDPDPFFLSSTIVGSHISYAAVAV
jgi:hypothetical protein